MSDKGFFLDDLFYGEQPPKVIPQLAKVAEQVSVPPPAFQDEPTIPDVPEYPSLKDALEGSGLAVDPDSLAKIAQHKQHVREAEKIEAEARSKRAEEERRLNKLPHGFHAAEAVNALQKASEATTDEELLTAYGEAYKALGRARSRVQHTIQRKQMKEIEATAKKSAEALDTPSVDF